MPTLDERLPDGRSVYQALDDLRRPKIRVAFGDRGLSGVETPPKINIPSIPTTPPSPNLPDVPIGTPNPRIDPSRIDFTPYPQDASKSQQLAIDLGAMRRASPRSPITEGPEGVSVGAPKPMGHGFKNTLKNIGRGLVIGMGDVAQSHPGASLGELLGGAGAGAIGGGLSPITIDRRIADEAIRRKQGELQNQLGIEYGQAQIDKAQRAPQPAERHVVGGRIIEKQPDGTWKEVYTPPVAEKPTKTGVHVVGGALVDDNGKVIYQSPEKPTTKPDLVGGRQAADRARKRDAAQRTLGSLEAAEAEAAKQKDAAYQEYGNLQAQYGRQPDAETRAALKPQLDAAKKKAEEAQKFYEGFGAKKTKAQKDIDENTDTMSAIEQKIYDAAKAKNLDPDEAVRRYRSGKY